MTILTTLIDTTHFELAQPLWEEQIAHAVFEPFFACMLVNITQSKQLVWYETFLAHSAQAATLSLDTATFAPELDLYWRKAHLDLKKQLMISTGADDEQLTQALPVAVHTAWAKLSELAYAQNQSIQQFAQSQLPNILNKLPIWADQVLDEQVLAVVKVEHSLLESLNPTPTINSDPDFILPPQTDITLNHPPNNQAVDHPQPPIDTPADQSGDEGMSQTDGHNSDSGIDSADDEDEDDPRQPSHLPKVLALVLVLGVAAAAYWYMKRQPEPAVNTNTQAQLATQNRPSPTLSISVGEQGELYACHARLGNQSQSDALLQTLGVNFGQTSCVIDMSEQVSQSMTGLDKLTSIIALLKTAPNATLEMTNTQILIDTPDTAAANRLVSDIGALLPQLRTQVMPTDEQQFINQSLTQASDALNALPEGANPHELAYAMSLQKIDTQSGVIADINQAVLALSAGKIASNPNARFIIVAHSDNSSADNQNARTQTQLFAELIKNQLIAQGANPDQLVAQGVGFDFPMANNKTAIGQFKNRRVEFLVYEEGVMQALQPKTIPQMPSVAGVEPTYAVIDGQIVETSAIPTASQNEMPVNEVPILEGVGSAPQVNVPIGAGPAPQIFDAYDNSQMIMLEPSQNEAYTPKPSAIPDDLVKPIGSDSSGGVQSSQVIHVE